MRTMQEIVEEITKERQKINMKLRWPLQRIIIRPQTQNTLSF
jgi:isoleucyl-tRNA synthetase